MPCEASPVRTLRGDPQTRGTVALVLGILGWVQAWEAPGSAGGVQRRSGLLARGNLTLRDSAGLGGGASLRVKSGRSLLALPSACSVGFGLRVCICKMTEVDELKYNFIVLTCHS